MAGYPVAGARAARACGIAATWVGRPRHLGRPPYPNADLRHEAWGGALL